jgi:hypothetical protein
MIRIRADFNSIDAEGRVRSHVSRATGSLEVADRVVAFDSDGNECEAIVELVDAVAGTVALELDTSTWRDNRNPSVPRSRT